MVAKFSEQYIFAKVCWLIKRDFGVSWSMLIPWEVLLQKAEAILNMPKLEFDR